MKSSQRILLLIGLCATLWLVASAHDVCRTYHPGNIYDDDASGHFYTIGNAAGSYHECESTGCIFAVRTVFDPDKPIDGVYLSQQGKQWCGGTPHWLPGIDTEIQGWVDNGIDFFWLPIESDILVCGGQFCSIHVDGYVLADGVSGKEPGWDVGYITHNPNDQAGC